MARSRQEGVLFLPFHLQHCVNNRNFAAQMVISEDLVTPFGEVRDEGREGIRCKAGAVPATVFALLVQRTQRHWDSFLGRRAAGQEPGNLPFRKNITCVLGTRAT